MSELKNNKHNIYYHYSYLYIVNAVIFRMLLTSHLKPDLAKIKKIKITLPLCKMICLAISVRAKVLHDPLVQYSRGLKWIDMAILTNMLFWKGRGSTETPSKLFANNNALGQLTNHNTFCFYGRRAFIKPGTNGPFSHFRVSQQRKSS